MAECAENVVRFLLSGVSNTETFREVRSYACFKPIEIQYLMDLWIKSDHGPAPNCRRLSSLHSLPFGG